MLERTHILLRFVVAARDPDSNQRLGAFAAAYALLRSGDLSEPEHTALEDNLEWFETKLPVPPTRMLTPRAIFWFRVSADAWIRRFWQMAHLLRQRGQLVTVLKTVKPGYVVYQDALQVAAVPFRDTYVRRRFSTPIGRGA